MGVDCSHCKCTNREDEKILIIENTNNQDKIMNVIESRREKINSIEKVKNIGKTRLNEILNSKPHMINKIIKLQSLIKKYRNRKVYKAILKKFRTSQLYFSSEEYFETITSNKISDAQITEKSHSYKSGALYTGQWLGGFRHAQGTMKWLDGTYYEGEWNLGYAEGKGILVYVNGDYMKGQFMYNKLNGYGECYNNELCYEYKGYWENDQQSGQGTELWPDGSEYIGFYEMGKKDGFGKYTWTDGSYYIGEWKDNKIHGLGIYYWSDGRIFAGEWKSSKMNGVGLFLWKDGRKYKGEYKDDKKSNFGCYYGNDDKKYEGFWDNGIQKELGKFTKKDGSFKLGYWQENQLISAIIDEGDIAQKLTLIDNIVEENENKLQVVFDNLRSLFETYLPNIPLEKFLEFN